MPLSTYVKDDPASDWSDRRFWRTVTPENIIERLAETGGVNACNEDGETPLHYAARHCSAEVITALLEAGAEIDTATQTHGHSALYLATAAGNSSAALALINAGANINEGPVISRRTPLIEAAKYCTVEVVSALINAGANVNASDWEGISALHTAAFNDPAIATTLLAAGALIEAIDDFQETPLFWAVDSDNPEVVKVLLDHNARVDRSNKYGDTPLGHSAGIGNRDIATMLIDGGALIEERNFAGRTPLYEAAREGRPDMVIFFIGKGADINAPDKHGQRPLAYVESKCTHSEEKDRADTGKDSWKEIAKVLREAGAEAEVSWTKQRQGDSRPAR